MHLCEQKKERKIVCCYILRFLAIKANAAVSARNSATIAIGVNSGTGGVGVGVFEVVWLGLGVEVAVVLVGCVVGWAVAVGEGEAVGKAVL